MINEVNEATQNKSKDLPEKLVIPIYATVIVEKQEIAENNYLPTLTPTLYLKYQMNKQVLENI